MPEEPAIARETTERFPPWRWLGGFLEVGALLCLVFPALGFLGRAHWFFDLLSHFRLQYIVVLGGTTLLLLALKRFRGAFAMGAIVVFLSFSVARYHWGPAGDPGSDDDASLEIVSFNVLTSNRRHGEVIAFLEETDADLVLLMEINDEWASRLEELKSHYPHRQILPREDNFGIALLSKLPFEDIELRYFGDAWLPSIDAVIEVGGSDVRFIGTHPLPPIGAAGSRARNGQLEALAAALEAEPTPPLVVAGDLNLTPWSPHFHDLLAATGLRDARLGFGAAPTWNRNTPWFAIPIDHVLVSEDVAVESFTVGPAMGSDHNPVTTRLKVPRRS